MAELLLKHQFKNACNLDFVDHTIHGYDNTVGVARKTEWVKIEARERKNFCIDENHFFINIYNIKPFIVSEPDPLNMWIFKDTSLLSNCVKTESLFIY